VKENDRFSSKSRHVKGKIETSEKFSKLNFTGKEKQKVEIKNVVFL